MTLNEFQRPVSVDSTPSGSQCEWCGKPAERRLTAVGGTYHNESGAFCHTCGDQFTQTVADSLHTPEITQAH